MLQSIRGFTDIYDPVSVHQWQTLESILISCAEQHGYTQIRLPFMEPTELFARAIGSTSDIVHKEMYTFIDKNGKSLTLRPEGTASCVRACMQHQLLYHNEQRLYYLSPMFRRERSQKGRLRQFHQFGLEALNIPSPEVDIEHLYFLHTLWKKLRIQPTLVINFIGDATCRKNYLQALQSYYSPYVNDFTDIEQDRFAHNPLRLLDSKNPVLMDINQHAPKIADFLSDDDSHTFSWIQSALQSLNIDYTVSHTLVRGLDYYTGLIYEWSTTKLGAQSAICGGGRYDLLTEQLYGKTHPCTGFSIGLERLIEITNHLDTIASKPIRIIFVTTPNKPNDLVIAEQLRAKMPECRVTVSFQTNDYAHSPKKYAQKGYDFLMTSSNTHPATYMCRNLQSSDQQSETSLEGVIAMISSQ